MKIITRPPVLVGKGCYGVWRVKVFYFDGRKHERDYVAFTSSEAKRRYMMEFGAVHQGCMYTEFIKKFHISEVNEMYIKHFICPYCGKELLNQNGFVDCDNENEFWCDNCDVTFIEEDGEIVEE